MDEGVSQFSPSEDPAFQAGLDELDRGLVDGPIVLQPGTRRPLLDLFPPVPTVRERHPARLARDPAATPHPPSPLRRDETFYGFSEAAFAVEPDLRFLYHRVEHDRVMQQIVEAIARRDGLIVVTGPPGIGKTILCRAIGDQLDRRTLTSLVSAPPVSVDALVQKLLVDFGVLPREEVAHAVDPRERLRTLRSFLASLVSAQAHAVVILDDAQSVSAEVVAVLDELATETARALQIVLVGLPNLTLGRVALRLRLGPLAADEVTGYVMHRVHIAATSPRIEFDDAALARLFDLSGGIPRLINQLCDRALTCAFERSASVIDVGTIATAAVRAGLATPYATLEPIPRVALAAGFVLLMAVGASASVLVFWHRVHLILVYYAYARAA